MRTVDAPPQYRQIELALRGRIATLPPGSRLPSDAELCAEFGVSRMTARTAMQRLADDGLIAREPGRGSFVTEPPTHRQANRLMTFTQEMLRTGRIPSSRVLTRVIRPSTPEEADDLGIPLRQPIVELRRLRLANAVPVALETAVLIGACAAPVMGADLERGSLHETLRQAGIVPRRGTATIAAADARSEDARLLGVRPGDPLLVERRVIVDAAGRRIEATESRYLADRYALVVRFDVDLPDGASD
ncbi:MAG TPA: GntR family transcriptional regulator [Candidatus Limnocylindria bacterium]|jgi:GntR family transcriptional regulator|nr:GntR family transcriptional regulator [Candidatus Limnocylindria bacterium]